MDYLDLDKVTCRICITGDESNDGLSNFFTKTIIESEADATTLIDDDYVLNMRLSDAFESYTCIEVGCRWFFICKTLIVHVIHSNNVIPLFQLQQDETRRLPETICRKCEFQLVETLSFIHRAKETQQILKSCAQLESKVQAEEIDMNEESSYLIEVLNDEGEVVIENEYDSSKSIESNNDKGKHNYCHDEDAVSFLKSVKREDAGTTETFKLMTVKKNHSCNYCKKRFLRKSNLVDHLRLHANVRRFYFSFFPILSNSLTYTYRFVHLNVRIAINRLSNPET